MVVEHMEEMPFLVAVERIDRGIRSADCLGGRFCMWVKKIGDKQTVDGIVVHLEFRILFIRSHFLSSAL